MGTNIVTLWGRDQGAINVLDAVEKAARERGGFYALRRYPGHSGDNPSGLAEALTESRVAVLGISSGMPEALIAKMAIQRNPELRVVFVQDLPSSSGVQDPMVREVGKSCTLCSIFGVPLDAPERDVFGSVVEVGFPDHWLPILNAMEFGNDFRAEGVLKLRRHGETGAGITAPPETVLIYISGFKDPLMEFAFLRELRLLKRIGDRPVVVHFRAHPGEKNFPELQEPILSREAILTQTWEVANPELVTGDNQDAKLIGAADITIAHPGATAVFHVGALRKKLICSMECVTEAHRRESSYDYAFTRKAPVKVIEWNEQLPSAIRSLLLDTPERAELARRLEEAPLFDSTTQTRYGERVMEVVENLLK